MNHLSHLLSKDPLQWEIRLGLKLTLKKQLSQKKSLIILLQLNSSFTTFYLFTISQPHLSNILAVNIRLKANGITPLVHDWELFEDQQTQNNFLFLDLTFWACCLRINTASAFPWYCILPVCTNLHKFPSKIFSYNLKACSNNFIPMCKFRLCGSLFPLKIGTNKLNIYTFGDLLSNKILNMMVKDFKQDSPPTFSIFKAIPGGSLAFLFFILFIAHCTL